MIAVVMRVLVAFALFATIVTAPVGGRAVARGSCWSWSRPEKKLARLHNNARERRDVPALRLDPELSKVARVHSREMARRGNLYHTPGETLGRRVTRWRRLGENVAVGTSARQAHRAFMGSSSHRAAIVDRGYRYFGVGVKRTGDRLWVTVVFSERRNPGTTLKMPC